MKTKLVMIAERKGMREQYLDDGVANLKNMYSRHQVSHMSQPKKKKRNKFFPRRARPSASPFPLSSLLCSAPHRTHRPAAGQPRDTCRPSSAAVPHTSS